jgi:hypothetical protein
MAWWNTVTTVEEHLRKVLLMLQRLGQEGTPLPAGLHQATGLRPSSMVFMRAPRVTHYQLHDGPHGAAGSHPSLHSSTSEGGQQQNEGLLWPPSQLWDSRKETESGCTTQPAAAFVRRTLQGDHQISDVVCRIQHHPKVKMVVVQLDRLAPYLHGTQDELHWGGSSVA